MAQKMIAVMVLIIVIQTPAALSQLTMPLIDVRSYNTCPVEEQHKNILQQIRSSVADTLHKLLIPECGDGLWYRVAYLNMTDPSQQCPNAWREYNTSGVRACGRPVSNDGSCSAVLYPTNRRYSKVCGRVIGYQFGTPDGFMQFDTVSLDGGYMDGVSITYGNPRHHIWSYVAGAFENSLNHMSVNCPCSSTQGTGPPTVIVGSNYYCESANPTNSFIIHIFSNDQLWDGEQCEGTCCSGTKSPPWFSVQLPSLIINKRIEVRICEDENTDNEDTPVELLEIYVQ